LKTSLKLKIAKDLYWRLGDYLNVDSRPPQNLPKTDYGSTSSPGLVILILILKHEHTEWGT
jgi:hypothetical protein